MEIKVLDKGYVKYVRSMGDDLSPLEDARMSTNNPTGVDEVKDDRLREHLWKNQHTSSFEGCVITLEIKIPLHILHQLDRHRTTDIGAIETYDGFRKYTSRNEFSGRYAVLPEEFYIDDEASIKAQDTINKQGSKGELSSVVKNRFIENVKAHSKAGFELYNQALQDGISREKARVLVSPNVYTKIRITANLVNWFKFLVLRLDKHAQFEIQEYARAIDAIINQYWPKCSAVFHKYNKFGKE